jgi:serine/threonine protein kinase/tetratricopeptide (TPR) repeat protein
MTEPGMHSGDEVVGETPRRIAGRYAIKHLLGRGGFGAVYEAYDELEERPVALKVIRADASLDPRATGSHSLGSSGPKSRFGHTRGKSTTRVFGSTPSTGDDVTEAFKDEFRLLTQLHHPNLAEVYEFGRCDEVDGVYFTQELVSGSYLSDFFNGASREVIVDVFVQLARALDYIHALGLVHEDIKPTNVLVVARPDGLPIAKLIDFGLARMLRGDGERADLASSEEKVDESEVTVLGTPGFSAPEKIRGESTDHRSDIYSLAATIYAAARGQRPFPAKNFKEALRAQMDWRPELAGVLLPTCGPVIAELVGRMLQPDAERRPQSARSIVLELLRREASHIRDRQETRHDRHEFARMLVEHLPFVDRSGYLDLLLTRATEILLPGGESSDTSRSGARARLIRTIVVEAPEGMGKARLLAELRREVQLGAGLFVEGNCWSTDRTALGPFAPIVLQLATALGESSPVLGRFADLVKLAREKGTDRAVGAQLMEFLVDAARERPYVLHLADLSRGQELERFEQLSRALDHNESPILLCATTTPHSKLSSLLNVLRRDQVVELWNLRPFSGREMEQVLFGVLGDTPVLPDLVTMLDKLTGGHPLSFRETLRVLIEEQILVRDADTWQLRGASSAAEDLHKTLAQRSESRLDGLGVSGWEVASILFLVEAPIGEDRLADLCDLRRERFRRTVDRLEGEGLIVRSAASGSSQVALAHESVREAVRRRYEGSLDETRLDLAARIDELETGDPNFLFLRARLLDDASQALEAIEALETTAQRLFAAGQPHLGAQVLERLIRRLRRHGGTANLPRLLDAKLALLREAAGALDDPRRESRHYEAGILIAELLGDFRAQALFWLGLSDRYTSDQEDMDSILARLERAADAAIMAHDRVLELRIANRRAEVLLAAGEIEQAGGYSRQAMEIIDIDDAQDVDVTHILGVRLRCLSLSGQLGEARRLHEMGKPIAARVPVVQRQSYLSGIAFLAVLGGDPARAIPETEAAIEQLRNANMPRLLLTPLHNLGDLRLRCSEFEGAAAAFREAIHLAGLYGFDHSVYLNRGFLGYTLARMGQLDEGAALLSEAKRAITQIPGEHVSLQQVRLLDAEVAHMLGQSARARRELEEMLADFHATNEVSLAHWAQDALARIERDLGHSFITAPVQEVRGDDGDPDVDTVRTKPVR